MKRSTAERRRVPLSQIDHRQNVGWLFGNGPDMRKANRGLLKKEGPPIHLQRRGGRYQVIDGNDRVAYARLAGRHSHDAWIWD